MRATKLVLLALAVCVSLAVRAEEEEAFVEHAARTSGRDIKIPRALTKKIEEEYREFLKKNEVAQKDNIQRGLLSMSVELWQRHPVALHENTRVVTPVGGGVVDFSELVTPLRGAFSLKILAHKDDQTEAPAGLRVFFVSKGKRRRLDGEEYGAGCGKFMEITKYFNKKSGAKSHGFDLYTAGQRYLSVVGGTFVVFAFEKEALSVGTLSFYDSRYPEVLCD